MQNGRIIPQELKPLLVDVKKIIMNPCRSHPHQKACVPIFWSKCCQYSVQLQWFQQDLVLFKGWWGFAKEKGLWIGDVVVFKYRDGGFDVKVFKHHTSTE